MHIYIYIYFYYIYIYIYTHTVVCIYIYIYIVCILQYKYMMFCHIPGPWGVSHPGAGGRRPRKRSSTYRGHRETPTRNQI